MAGHMGQEAAHDESARAYFQNAENARSAATTTYAYQQNRILQERDAAVQQKTEGAIAALKARSTAATSAGEAGVVGLSVDHLLGDYFAQEGRRSDAIDTNFQMSRSSILGDMESTKAGAQNQINSQRISPRPSLLDTGLKIGGAALNAGSSFFAMKNPTPRRG